MFKRNKPVKQDIKELIATIDATVDKIEGLEVIYDKDFEDFLKEYGIKLSDRIKGFAIPVENIEAPVFSRYSGSYATDAWYNTLNELGVPSERIDEYVKGYQFSGKSYAFYEFSSHFSGELRSWIYSFGVDGRFRFIEITVDSNHNINKRMFQGWQDWDIGFGIEGILGVLRHLLGKLNKIIEQNFNDNIKR